MNVRTVNKTEMYLATVQFLLSSLETIENYDNASYSLF